MNKRGKMSVKQDDIFMRLLVFFDLPVTETEDRRIAARFRKDLLNEGFMMLQFSIYCRVCRGLDIVEREIRRIKKVLPPKLFGRFARQPGLFAG